MTRMSLRKVAVSTVAGACLGGSVVLAGLGGGPAAAAVRTTDSQPSADLDVQALPTPFGDISSPEIPDYPRELTAAREAQADAAAEAIEDKQDELRRIAAERRAKARAKAARAASRAAARAAAQAADARDLPVPAGSYHLTARFGQPGGWSAGYHTGLDFAAPPGTDVFAARAGTVISTGWAGAYGNRIEISHGNGVVTTYNHLSNINVSTGERVGAGQKIGDVGTTGRSTGPHLHFEVEVGGSFRNPADWLGL